MVDDQGVAVQYALGQPKQRTGIGGLPLNTTVAIAVGFGVFLVCQLAGARWWGFVVVIPVTALVAVLISVRVANRSLWEYVQIFVRDWRRCRRGADVYVSGGLSLVPGGRRRLPGLLARTEAVVGVDVLGREFVVVVDRPRREATVLLDVTFTGQTAMTQDERNAATAEWSRWLASLSLSGDVEQAVVVVGVRPGSGQLVAGEVSSIVDDQAPEIARRIVVEAAEAISHARPEVSGHIAVTVKVDGESLRDDAFLSQLGTRVPTWCSSLQWAGVLAEPMSYELAVARVHSFFNPAAEADFEELLLASEGHGVAWEDAGPLVARVRSGCYEHDGVVSVTWEMRDAPRSTFEDTLLRGLVAPHERIDRKRVVLCYRPFEAGAGASRVEAEHRDAMVAANSSKSITSAKAEMRLEHTEAARRAQARGAQLGRFSLFVTATVGDRGDLSRVCHDVEQLAAGSSIRLQVMKHQQDVGFQVTCGVGKVPWPYSSSMVGM
ncbi:hypothetical protein CMUST_15540 (plasmid) [Corynebacterium mustelae]|uniref:PrgI family protein n=1 Tax=Corynebacterium mustelae TaxID=571915 RepID=A0A0G3H8C6_9CORY|nr:SCO6880 family protein [Corynebacterium mustelae]AKK07397.1 hypothetical protein CMUST_15540 [Corynebacterium mustelae]